MHLTNDSPSFTPVHSQIRAIGPQDLHLWKGRGLSRAEAALTNDLEGLGTLRQLLEAVELEGVLIQADALHANRPFSSTSPSAAPTS